MDTSKLHWFGPEKFSFLNIFDMSITAANFLDVGKSNKYVTEFERTAQPKFYRDTKCQKT